jgi:hypothetical protein
MVTFVAVPFQRYQLTNSTVSGGVACAAGAVAILAAIPSLVRYDSRLHFTMSATGARGAGST